MLLKSPTKALEIGIVMQGWRMSPRNYTTSRDRRNLCKDSTKRGVTEETLFNSPQQVKV